MKVSTATDASTKAIEEKEYSASYSVALAQHMKDASIYNANMEKVNGLLWANCTTALKLKIKERPDYESKIEDDAVALINAIEEHALGYDKAKAEKEVLIDTCFNLFNVRQKDDEDLASYYLRFISAIKLYDRHFGAQISLHNTEQKMKKIFPSKDEKEIQTEEWNCLLAYLFIYRSDQDKYGMFVENLRSQEAMGHKQIPETVEESLQILSGQTFEKKFCDKMARRKSGESNRQEKPDDRNNDEKHSATESWGTNSEHTLQILKCLRVDAISERGNNPGNITVCGKVWSPNPTDKAWNVHAQVYKSCRDVVHSGEVDLGLVSETKIRSVPSGQMRVKRAEFVD